MWKHLFIFLIGISFAKSKHQDIELIPTDRPLIIAHRGSSGMLPEHTVEAYQLAIDQGADVIECDVVMTKDLHMVCLHDPWMSDSTDVTSHPEFRNRKRNLTVGGKELSDYFTFDFTLEELETLRVIQSRDYRDQSYNGKYHIATLRDYLDVVKNASRGVAIYPELKYPSLFNEFIQHNEKSKNGAPRFEDLLMQVLREYGYNSGTSPCFVQCFEIGTLQYLKNQTMLPLIFLSSDKIEVEELQELTQYIYGIGVSKDAIVKVDRNGHIVRTTTFVEDCHNNDLKVHAWTFRNEDRFLAFDYGADITKEYAKHIDLKVDGFFTDYPQTFNDYLNGINCDTSNAVLGAQISIAFLIFAQVFSIFLVN